MNKKKLASMLALTALLSVTAATAAGSNIACTFTNTKRPTITLTKISNGGVGGFTFTGTSRHFVQYRDAGAPFGYDATQLLSTELPLCLYHDAGAASYRE